MFICEIFLPKSSDNRRRSLRRVLRFAVFGIFCKTNVYLVPLFDNIAVARIFCPDFIRYIGRGDLVKIFFIGIIRVFC